MLKSENSTKAKVFGTEEDEAVRRDPIADLEKFHSCCDYIKTCISKVKDLKNNSDKDVSQDIKAVRTDAVVQFVEMKKLNRLAHFRCRRGRESTIEAKHKIDQCHLTLQNLLYEVMHLQKEVTKCMEFKSKDEEIELVSVDEFYANAPASVSNPDVTKTDIHRQTLARLEWELEQRKELAVKRKETETEKEKITQDIKAKEDYLETLQPKLSAILAATRPVQDYLDIPYDAVRDEHRKAQHLTPPLYVLYMQLAAYKEACDGQLKVRIEGDVEAAKSLSGHSVDMDEDSDSDQDDQDPAESKRRRKKIESRRQDRKDKILQKHPLTILLEISLEDGTTLQLTFNSLVALKILTVNVKVTMGANMATSSISGGDLMSSDFLLDELYPGDHGNDSPNLANHYELQKYGLEELSSYISVVGRPYLWCQWLGGLQFLTQDVDDQVRKSVTASANEAASGDNASQDSSSTESLLSGKDSNAGKAVTQEVVQAKHSVSASHMENTIKRLKKRLCTRVKLMTHISSIERGIIPLSQELVRLFPAKINAKLLSWKRSTFEDLRMLKQSESAIKIGAVTPTDFFYQAVVMRGSAKLTAHVVITADSPIIAPYFILDVIWQKHRTALNDINIRGMEEELNLHFEELVPGKHSRDFLLAAQLQRLLMCFDVYLETEGNSSAVMPIEFPVEKILPRISRGRCRAKPYKYVPELGIFTQRL